jgi:phage terminase large subunit-like protein
MSAHAESVLRWARFSQRDYLLSSFLTFAKASRMCPDINEAEYGDVCMYLEEMMPATPKIQEWRIKYGRLKAIPERFLQEYGLFLIPRRCFKTSLIAALCVFIWLIDPAVRITLGRATTTDAESTLAGIKEHIELNPTLIRAFGDLRSMFRVWVTTHILTSERPPGAREATIDTTGLNSSKTGFHPDMVILDDLVNETNYESPTEMYKAAQKIDSFKPIVERWGTILVVGTRWGEYDVYGRIIQADMELAANGRPSRWKKFICGAYRENGQPRFPTPLPDYIIERMRDDTPPKLFAAWILNRARAENEDIFTSAYIQYVDAEFVGGPYGELHLQHSTVSDPMIARFGNRVPLAVNMYIDPAPTVEAPGSKPNRKRDFTGIVVVGFDDEAHYWVLHAEEIKMMPSDRVKRILQLVEQYEPYVLRLENADLDGVMLQLKISDMGLRTKVARFDTTVDRRSTLAAAGLFTKARPSKAAQIEALEPLLRGRRVFFVRGKTGPLVRQLIEYPQMQHDDVLDAFSMCRLDEQASRQNLRIDLDVYAVETERAAWKTALNEGDRRYREATTRQTAKSERGPWAGPYTPVRGKLAPPR